MGNVCCSDNDTNFVNTSNDTKNNMLPFNNNIMSGTFKDRAYGVIIGSLIGNSIGAFTDHSKRSFQSCQLFGVMQMQEGGYHGTAAGQVSSDGELTMCLLKAIVDSNRSHREQMSI